MFVSTFVELFHAGRLILNATSGTHIYFDKETNVRRGPLLQVSSMVIVYAFIHILM